MNAHQLAGGEDRSSAPKADELDFRLTVEEAELVLEALGSLRYSTVYRLIAKLQTQARQQVASATDQQVADGDRPADPVELREVAGGPRR